MGHTAGSKTFYGKGFTHHVIHTGSKTAVAGFSSVESAVENSVVRNEKGEALGIGQPYVVKNVDDCTYVDD